MPRSTARSTDYRRRFGFSVFLAMLGIFFLFPIPALFIADRTSALSWVLAVLLPILAWGLYQARRRAIRWRALAGPLPGWRALRWLALLPLVWAFTFGLFWVVLLACETFWPGWLAGWLSAQQADRVDFSGWAGLLAGCLLGPALEELLFRGFFLQAFMTRMRAGSAILLSATLFALLHWSPMMAGQFVGAIVLSLAYLHTRSLFVPFLMHGLWNLASAWHPTAEDVDIAARLSEAMREYAANALWLAPLCLAGAAMLAWVICKLWPAPDHPLPYAANGGAPDQCDEGDEADEEFAATR